MGTTSPLLVEAGYTEREVCDGQGLSSPGRWSQDDRLYPSSSLWLQIQRMIFHTAETLTSSSWHGFVRGTQDRRELPFDFRLFHILLSAAGYPEVKMCEFDFGVRVCLGNKASQMNSTSLSSGFRTKIVLVPSITDNRGNGSRLIKLIANRYPLSALLKNFSEQFLHTGIRLEVRWSPRETNAKKDRLANGESTVFSPSLRVRVFPLRSPWYVLNEALEMGTQAE